MTRPHTFHCRIYYEDVDIGGYCYHSKYLNLCERARSEIFFQQGLSPVYKDYHFVVKSIMAEYIKPGFFGDELKIHTRVLKQTNASLKLLQVVNNQDDETLFTMEVLLVCLQGSRVSKIPTELSKVFKP